MLVRDKRRYSRGSHRMESSHKKKPIPCHLKRSKVPLVTNPKQPTISHNQKNLMSRRTLQGKNYTSPLGCRMCSRGSLHRVGPRHKKKLLPCYLKRFKVLLVTKPKQPITTLIQKNLMTRKTLQIVSHRYKKPGSGSK